MALKNYEIVLVFSLSKGEEAAQALKTKFTDLISKHGTLGEVEDHLTPLLRSHHHEMLG